VLADGSGSYPDAAPVNDVVEIWRAGYAIPDWANSADRGAGQWSFPGFFIQRGRHSPSIVFARHDHAYDEVQEL
jgi:hypothetical protein